MKNFEEFKKPVSKKKPVFPENFEEKPVFLLSLFFTNFSKNKCKFKDIPQF